MFIQLIAVSIFVLGYLTITLEHKLKISKSATALLMGIALWLLVPFLNKEHFQEILLHSSADIFGIVIFLLAAMSLVEILVHYQFFDIIRGKLFKLKLNDKQQFTIMAIITFFLSAVVDNLTCTIVMIQIARQFFTGRNLIIAAAGIVISANAGGAFSPIGDVTTIMLWLQKKFTAMEVITKGFLPSLAMLLVTIGVLYPKIVNKVDDVKEEIITKLGRSERLIVATVFGSFMLPIFLNQIGLPPYMGLLLGLGIVWMLIDLLKQLRPKQTHLSASIDEFIKKTDISSLKFFIGILLAVSALESLHILDYLSTFLYGQAGSENLMQIIAGNIGLGALSAILDNVPLTAIAMDILHTSDTSLWVLLALAVGTGGSMLVIGSAAGVVAMGMIKELTFGNYIKYGTVAAAAAYIVGMAVWAVQYFVFGF